MQLRTTECSRAGHKEFVLTIDETKVLSQDADQILAFVQGSVSRGSRFEPGQTVQIGWMITKVAEREDKTLALLEPTFTSMPIIWVESVTLTVQHMRLQRDVA